MKLAYTSNCGTRQTSAEAALLNLPAGSRVELPEGATHGFPGRFDEAITLALPFVASRLCPTT